MPPPPARPDSPLRMGRELPEPLEPSPAREWDLTQRKPLIKSEICLSRYLNWALDFLSAGA